MPQLLSLFVLIMAVPILPGLANAFDTVVYASCKAKLK